MTEPLSYGRLAVLSGKGGTGKTLISTSLAVEAGRRGLHTVYVDADVEEPNGHLLLHPSIEESEPVTVRIPELNRFSCSRCGRCVSHCAFDAIVLGGRGPVFFPELCHDCGACALVCPDQAIGWTVRTVGSHSRGTARSFPVIEGRLRVGEPRSKPLIEQLVGSASESRAIIDCPPGASCPTMTALSGSERAVIVTEPTILGAHDLGVVLELCEKMGRPVAVVLNRADRGSDVPVLDVLGDRAPILARIPYDEGVVRAAQRGVHPMDESIALQSAIWALHDALVRWAGGQQAPTQPRKAAS